MQFFRYVFACIVLCALTVNKFNVCRGLLSKSEVEVSPTMHTGPVEDHLETSHSRNINSVVRPYQPVGSDGESDIYDDCTWQESSVVAKESDTDDVDRHRNCQSKPLLVENVYRYTL